MVAVMQPLNKKMHVAEHKLTFSFFLKEPQTVSTLSQICSKLLSVVLVTLQTLSSSIMQIIASKLPECEVTAS